MPKTLTAEEFKKRYGQEGINKFSSETKKQPSYLTKVGGNLVSTFVEGAKDILKTGTDVYNKTEVGNVGVGEKILNYASGVGRVAGTIASTAGGIIGSYIEPVLPESAKKVIGNIGEYVDNKIQSIPGMTPEIHHALGDVFNTISLLGGSEGANATKNAAGRVVNAGEKIIDSGSEVVKNITNKVPQYGDKAVQWLAAEPSEQVKTILKETPKTKFDEFGKIAEDSSIDPRKTSVFEKVGENLTEATKQLQKQTGSIGAQKSGILQKARTGLQNFTDAPRRAVLKVMQLEENPLKEWVISKLKSVKTKLDADKAIDSIQAKIYDATGTGLIAQGSKIERQLQGIVGEMNNALKDTLPESYRVLNAKYAENTKMLGTLNKTLGEVVDGVPIRGASLIKQFFSPAGSKAKEIFDFVKRRTGVDLAQDTTVAKFFGEIFDDPKVKSLLEGLPTSKSGVINKIVNVVAEKSGTIKKAQQAVQKATINKARILTK